MVLCEGSPSVVTGEGGHTGYGLFPRFGRWLDGKPYRAFPRLGPLFMPEEPRDEETGAEG